MKPARVRVWRRGVLVAGLGILTTGTAASSVVEGGSQTDEAAIKQVIANWDNGWKGFDATLATQDYATDADWTNAFGESAKGRVGIHQYLANLYTKPGIRSRKSTPSTSSVRFVQSNVAAVSSYRETVGQRSASGAAYPTRKTHDLRIVVREKGHWLIVSHLIMDEKEARP
jgi:uncharacterized protein (TIGR02246 family)